MIIYLRPVGIEVIFFYTGSFEGPMALNESLNNDALSSQPSFLPIHNGKCPVVKPYNVKALAGSKEALISL